MKLKKSNFIAENKDIDANDGQSSEKDMKANDGQSSEKDMKASDDRSSKKDIDASDGQSSKKDMKATGGRIRVRRRCIVRGMHMTIRLEGFGIERVLTECIRRKISLKHVIYEEQTSICARIDARNLEALEKLIGKRYRLTILSYGGAAYAVKRVFSNKTRLAGILIFAALIYFQSCFIAEIRIDGYSGLTETEIRQCLKTTGLYEGARIDKENTEQIEQVIYDTFEEVSWTSVSYKGRLAMVTVIEAPLAPAPMDETTPCHIVAAKAGYIYEVIPENGLRAVQDGAYVSEGAVLISGIIPLKSTAYGTEAVNMTERYVHALGSVKAVVPYRYKLYQERFECIKEKTGKVLPGIEITFGGHTINTISLFNPFEASIYREKNLIALNRPIPFMIKAIMTEEVAISQRERLDDEIMAMAKGQVRAWSKEKLPEKAQILNNSLKFSRGENIIEVVVTLEALQEIGKEQEIIFGEPKPAEGNNNQISD